MTISEALARSAIENKPVHCVESKAEHHPSTCICKGTGWVVACAVCNGSGFNAMMQQVCATCSGRGATSAPPRKHDNTAISSLIQG